MKFRSALKMIVVASLLVAATTTQAAMTLFDLSQPGAEMQVSDKVFYNFVNINQTGNVPPVPLNLIQVNPLLSGGPSGTEIGIQFQYPWSLVGPNLWYDLAFQFMVRTEPLELLLSDNTLEITGGFVADGGAQIAETVKDVLNNDIITSPKFVYFHSTGSDTSDHRDFIGGPYNTIKIGKDFYLYTGANENSQAFVSHFDQTFSQVPEPASISLMLLGAAGMVCSRRRR